MNSQPMLMFSAILLLSLVDPVVSAGDSRCLMAEAACLRAIDDDAPRMELDAQTCDLGELRVRGGKSAKAKCRFRFRNTGGQPLVVTEVETSCGCTSARFSPKPVQPGRRGTITVIFDPASQPAGPFRKSILVYSNVPGGYVRLFIKGTVVR